MHAEDDYTPDRKAHWQATQDPQRLERERAIADRLGHAEIMVEDLLTATPDAPAPYSETQVKKLAGISTGQWEYLRRIRSFRDRYYLGFGTWSAWTVPVLQECGSFLLKNYKSPAEKQREKADRSQRKVAVRQAAVVRRDGKPFQKSEIERQAISERMKAAWARRKAQGEKLPD